MIYILGAKLTLGEPGTMRKNSQTKMNSKILDLEQLAKKFTC